MLNAAIQVYSIEECKKGITVIGISEIQVKKALGKDYFAGSMFGGMYTFSPYMGCSHGCLYCDGRAEKYYFEGNFSKDLKVRTNIPSLLASTLPGLRENAPIHLSSGISDIYQEAERKYYLTGRCSEILSDFDFHVSVLTKSSLVLRDFDNWIKVNKKGGFTLQMSLTTLDDNIRKKMEPGASSVEERLEAIRAFKDEDCSVGIYMMPLLPGITDTESNIEKLLTKLSDLNVDYFSPSSLSLRPGRQKDLYLNEIEKSFPFVKELYLDIYRENRISGWPVKSFDNCFNSKIEKLFKGIYMRPPHSYYRNTMPIYCELIILIQHMIILYSNKKIDVTSLKKSYGKLHNYLTLEKRYFNRKKSLPSNYIDDNLKFLLETDGINNIVENPRLVSFMKNVVLGRKIFDYNTLKLS